MGLADASYAFTIAVDPFTLVSGSNVIGGINWWGACITSTFAAATCPTGSFTVTIYSDNSGVPGTALDSYNVGNAGQTLTGNNVTVSSVPVTSAQYSYSVSIPALTLAAATQYWLGISDNTSSSLIWTMEGSGSSSSGSHDQYETGTGWVSEPNELAFNLTSPTPEPGTFLLLSAAGILSVFLRRQPG